VTKLELWKLYWQAVKSEWYANPGIVVIWAIFPILAILLLIDWIVRG